MVNSVKERIAVFVDGENLPADVFDEISSHANQLGECLEWKVFGDFSQNGHAEWLGACRKHGIQAVMELPMESGKNSTDIAVVIAAMDLLHANTVDALVLASDDRDFLPLVRRLRSGGINVYGFGRKEANPDLKGLHTSWTRLNGKPVARIAADKIQVVEPLSSMKPPPVQSSVNKPASNPEDKQAALKREFKKQVHAKLEEGQLSLSALGVWIRQTHPDLVALIGKGKLKKLLLTDSKLKLKDPNVSLIK